MKVVFVPFLLLLLAAPFAAAEESAPKDELVEWLKNRSELEVIPPTWKPLFGLRLRQEYLQKVYYFDPESSTRNWLRLRTRAGLQWNQGSHRLEFRLANEFRVHYALDVDEVEYDEIIVDRAAWTWGTRRDDAITLTLGRQDIIWDDGFLMLEGHPLDGSRSIYHNALRMQFRDRRGEYELLGIVGPQKDELVIAGDQERSLSDHDEVALAIRYLHHTGTAVSLIYKKESLVVRPHWDWCNLTLALRKPWRAWVFEGALQRHSTKEWAYAMQLRGGADLLRSTRGELGYFHYSGDTEDHGAFRTPYGRWPKWSELYLYTLVGEEGPAAWRNIAGLHAHLHQELLEGVRLRMSAYWLGAPDPEWRARGLLLQSEFVLDYTDWLSMHFLWEYLDPGEAYADAQDDAHFLRWEINYDFK